MLALLVADNGAHEQPEVHQFNHACARGSDRPGPSALTERQASDKYGPGGSR